MKTILTKKIITLVVLVCMAASILSSCKKDDEVDTVEVFGNMNIRVVNAVVGSNAQDFYQNSTKLSTTAVSYGENTPYLTGLAGTSTFSFKNAGTSVSTATLLSASTGTNVSYTVYYLTDGSGTAQITGFVDDNTAPSSGKAKVRFVNLGLVFANNLNVNVSGTGGASLVTGLAFNNATANYASIDPNTALDFTVIGSGIVGTIPGSNFVAGKIYTVWFDATNSTTANFHVITQN